MSRSPAMTPRWPAFVALVREVGLVGAVRIGWRLERAARRGEPFEALPPPADGREALSRAQVGPAVLLYRELTARLGAEAGLAATERVVLASGVRFMRKTLGPLTQAELARLDDEGRRAFAESRGERFFNATIDWERIAPDEVRFTVTACRFPALCRAAGAAELAPVFCRVDRAYFGAVEPNVELERATTIADGGERCPFSLKWK